MKITLITLNYNGADSTIRLLESLEKQTDKDLSIIVADNGSSDVQKLHDYNGVPIHILENGSNLGFAGGNNPAIIYAFEHDSDWAVLLNNDTTVEATFIKDLKEGLKDCVGLAGMPIREESGGIAYSGKLAWLKKPTRRDFHIYEPGADIADRYVIGAGMAISRSAFEKLGPMDENYFLYFEDIDYSYTAKQKKIPVDYLKNPIINHQLSTTSKKELGVLIHRYHYRNALYFNFKNGSLLVKILAIPWSIYIVLKQLFKILTNDHVRLSKAIIAGVIDFYQEKMGYISTKTKIGIECESIEGKNPQWGIAKIIMRSLEEISKRPELGEKFEFTLYFKDTIPDFPFLKSPLFKTKKVPVPGAPHRLFPFYYYLLLPIQLWSDRNDVIWWPNYMLPIIAFGKSHVILTEDIYYEAHDGALPFRYRLAYWLFGWWTAHFATKILAISETSKNNVAQLYDINLDRLVVNHLGIDPINTLHKKEGDYILYAAQAFPRRHLRETMLAFRKISADFPDLRFFIIAIDKYPKPMIEPLMKEVNTKLGREAIIHKEYISQAELDEYYAGAKALVYVSDREAFGLPPMEALSIGVPSLVADNALGHELLGENAVFVSEPNSVDLIAAGIREAMTNSALREKIKEHEPIIARRYTWKAFTDRLIETLTSIAHHA